MPRARDGPDLASPQRETPCKAPFRNGFCGSNGLPNVKQQRNHYKHSGAPQVMRQGLSVGRPSEWWVRMLRTVLGLLMSLILGSAAFAQDTAAPGEPPAGSAGGVDPAPSAAQVAADKFEYHLGSGDKVRIIVFGEESLSGEFLVPGGAGTIAFPLVGDVQAAGLSVTELQAHIKAKLKDGYLKDPRVSIEVLNYRPFYILGEVMRPGQYSYTSGLTVLNAVATASGFTYRANTHKVFIKRPNTPGEVEYDLKTTTPVEPGDTIRIGERFF